MIKIETIMEKKTQGGKRKGAGRPKKEETDTIGFRIPKKLKQELMSTYKGTLNGLFTKFLEGLKSDSFANHVNQM